MYYDFSEKINLKLEWTHSNYIIHLAGPLNDSLFKLASKMSTRKRNYYSPSIHIPSITLKWDINPNTKIELLNSAILGVRNSVIFDKPANIEDTINPLTLQYNNRQVDIDNYKSFTGELRLINTYKFFNQKNSISMGIQYMNNDLHRRQQGKELQAQIMT